MCRNIVNRFARSTKGNVALIFAVTLLPAAFLISAGLDYSRASGEKAKLQNVVDSAALAGAQAYATKNSSSAGTSAVATYMTSASAQLHGTNLTYTSSPSSTTKNGLTAAYAMQVSATENVASNSLSSGWVATGTVGAKATATIGMSYVATFKLNNFSSIACDGNSIYWYKIPPDNSVPTAAALTKVWSNTDTNNPSSVTMTIQFGETVGFALKNVTGQICAYGKTAYGSSTGQTNWFYSHLLPPSKGVFPSVSQNCSLMTILDPMVLQLPPSMPGNVGTCAATLPNNAALDCSALVGHTVLYLWNDMGGIIDDKDYNDADYTVSCAAASGGITAGTGSTLTQ